jgi:hypothetical protein
MQGDWTPLKRGMRVAWLLAITLAPLLTLAGEDDLQKKLANPVSDLVTVPFQYTATLGIGPEGGRQDTLNIQPVYPVALGRWNLIHRLVVPLVSAPAFASGQGRVGGIGDIVYEGFLSPAAPGKLIWGAGPIVQFNTASNDQLGSGKSGAGPAVVALQQTGPWSVGALVTQVWSFAGNSDRAAVNQLQLQPVVSFTIDPRHTVGYNGTIVANWHAKPAGDVWTVPIGMSYSILVRRPGSIPINFIVAGGYNVVTPSAGGEWYLRLQMNLIFSKK